MGVPMDAAEEPVKAGSTDAKTAEEDAGTAEAGRSKLKKKFEITSGASIFVIVLWLVLVASEVLGSDGMSLFFLLMIFSLNILATLVQVATLAIGFCAVKNGNKCTTHWYYALVCLWLIPLALQTFLVFLPQVAEFQSLFGTKLLLILVIVPCCQVGLGFTHIFLVCSLMSDGSPPTNPPVGEVKSQV
jgi:hypothetical protein